MGPHPGEEGVGSQELLAVLLGEDPPQGAEPRARAKELAPAKVVDALRVSKEEAQAR